MNIKKIKDKKGFTLIEVIIGLSIIAIVSITFFNIINSSIKYNVKNEKDIKSLNIAQAEIENIRNAIKEPGDFGEEDRHIRINEEILIPSETITWEPKKILVDSKYIEKEFIKIEGDDTNNILEYTKTIPGDNTIYNVKLDLSRTKKASKSSSLKYLYDIRVEVRSNNQKLSNKTTVLKTSILTK